GGVALLVASLAELVEAPALLVVHEDGAHLGARLGADRRDLVLDALPHLHDARVVLVRDPLDLAALIRGETDLARQRADDVEAVRDHGADAALAFLLPEDVARGRAGAEGEDDQDREASGGHPASPGSTAAGATMSQEHAFAPSRERAPTASA